MKRILVILLAITMLLTLVACRNSNNYEDKINEDEHPILVHDYYNGAWGLKAKITFVTNKGNIYTSNTTVNCDEVMSSSDPIDVLDNKDLIKLYDLLDKLKNKDLSLDQRGYDGGDYAIYAYKDSEQIELYHSGDEVGERTDKVAQDLIDFAFDYLPLHDDVILK